jgi:hypothetical protein
LWFSEAPEAIPEAQLVGFCRDENTGRSIYIKDIPDDSGTRSQAVLQYRLQAYYELAKAVNATDRLGLGMDSPAGPLVIIIT